METSAEAGEVADKLNAKLKGSATVIAFRQEDVFELLKFSLSKQSLETREKDAQLTFGRPVNDSAFASSRFEVSATGSAFSMINVADLKDNILGMKDSDAHDYIQGFDGVDSGHILLAPHWSDTLPEDAHNV